MRATYLIKQLASYIAKYGDLDIVIVSGAGYESKFREPFVKVQKPKTDCFILIE